MASRTGSVTDRKRGQSAGPHRWRSPSAVSAIGLVTIGRPLMPSIEHGSRLHSDAHHRSRIRARRSVRLQALSRWRRGGGRGARLWRLTPPAGASRRGCGRRPEPARALAVLIGLGTWQVERLHWKRALIAEREAQLAAPPEPLPATARTGGLGFPPGHRRRQVPPRSRAAVRRGRDRRPRRPSRADAAGSARMAPPSWSIAAGCRRTGRIRRRAARGSSTGAVEVSRHRALPRRRPARLVHARQPAGAGPLVRLRPAGARSARSASSCCRW